MTEIKTPSYFKGEHLYRAVWRWHFYVAILVIPFLSILALTGFLMLLSKPLDNFFIQHKLISVTPQKTELPAAMLLSIVQQHYPDKQVQLYIPAKESTESARFSLVSIASLEHASHNAASTTVYINPYTGEILGTQDPTKTLYAWVKTLHGSLFLGNIGDGLIETTSGLALLMVLSGLYLAWPRRAKKSKKLQWHFFKREDWRQLHRRVGLFIAIPLIFFLISGLAWTNIWGGKIVQPWSSLPGTQFKAPISPHNHESMNQKALHQVPWVMEQTPLPESNNSSSDTLDLDAIIRIARLQGFEHFRVHLANKNKSVWTVSATTIAGDITNPQKERTIHLDPSNGELLADIPFSDYPAMGKAMSAFIPLHQGELGLWNLLLNLFMVSLVLFMVASGIILWWKRRPSQAKGLQPPVASPVSTKLVAAVMGALSICFPLSACVLVLVILLDWILVSRVGLFRVAVK